MNEPQQQKITMQEQERHQIGNITLVRLAGSETPVRLSIDGVIATGLTLDQAMELSIILEIWTREYGGKPTRKEGGTHHAGE